MTVFLTVSGHADAAGPRNASGLKSEVHEGFNQRSISLSSER